MQPITMNYVIIKKLIEDGFIAIGRFFAYRKLHPEKNLPFINLEDLHIFGGDGEYFLVYRGNGGTTNVEIILGTYKGAIEEANADPSKVYWKVPMNYDVLEKAPK